MAVAAGLAGSLARKLYGWTEHSSGHTQTCLIKESTHLRNADAFLSKGSKHDLCHTRLAHLRRCAGGTSAVHCSALRICFRKKLSEELKILNQHSNSSDCLCVCVCAIRLSCQWLEDLLDVRFNFTPQLSAGDGNDSRAIEKTSEHYAQAEYRKSSI